MPTRREVIKSALGGAAASLTLGTTGLAAASPILKHSVRETVEEWDLPGGLRLPVQHIEVRTTFADVSVLFDKPADEAAHVLGEEGENIIRVQKPRRIFLPSFERADIETTIPERMGACWESVREYGFDNHTSKECQSSKLFGTYVEFRIAGGSTRHSVAVTPFRLTSEHMRVLLPATEVLVG